MRAWLREKGIDIEDRDFFQDRLSEDELLLLLQGRNVAEIFSWTSPSFKALELAPSELDDDALLQLMLQEPRLIRRPLIKIGDKLIIGGSQNVLDKAFP